MSNLTIETPVPFKGVPGSPYTRKMLALLRYRHIPYRLLVGNQAADVGMPDAKVALLPTFYFKDETNEYQAVVDSTPIARQLEAAFPQRSALPPSPVLRFIDYLLEDYGDEWLTKSMFHYRWYYDPDIKMAGRILPLWSNLGMSPEQHEKMGEFIADRQISRLYVVGSNDTTAPLIEASYGRFLAIMDKLIQAQPFLMGSRPGVSDFAFYAQLTQLARFDPTPQARCLEEAPRVFAWTDVVDDLSGTEAHDDGWLADGDIREVLGELLTEVGRTYVAALLANAKAINEGQGEFSTTIDGETWQQPVFPYQAKCLQSIRIEFANLDDDAKETVRTILDGTGCDALL